LGGAFLSGSLLDESSWRLSELAVAVAAPCPLTDSFTGVLRAFIATLVLFILFTAMLPMLWIEFTALGRLVVDVVVEDADEVDEMDVVVLVTGAVVELAFPSLSFPASTIFTLYYLVCR
jgi:hypothetical protein